MTTVPAIALNDGAAIPQLGLGVWQTPNDGAADAVATAIEAGYRHIDTAMIYENEEGVGDGIRRSGIARDALFVTTKLWNSDQGYDAALKAMDASLKRLGLDHVDLYLIHWPAPHLDRYVESWKALVKLREEGKARSIGVSNFMPEHLDRIVEATGVTPAINQVETHPRFQQRALRKAHAERDIVHESWSPLGKGQLLDDETIGRIAKKHGVTPAQAIIRWHLDNGLVVIPKSVTRSRIRENIDVFGFALDAEDMAAIEALDDAGGRTGPDPTTARF